MRETKQELAFSREIRRTYRPKGLPAFITTAKKYVRLLQEEKGLQAGVTPRLKHLKKMLF